MPTVISGFCIGGVPPKTCLSASSVNFSDVDVTIPSQNAKSIRIVNTLVFEVLNSVSLFLFFLQPFISLFLFFPQLCLPFFLFCLQLFQLCFMPFTSFFLIFLQVIDLGCGIGQGLFGFPHLFLHDAFHFLVASFSCVCLSFKFFFLRFICFLFIAESLERRFVCDLRLNLVIRRLFNFCSFAD